MAGEPAKSFIIFPEDSRGGSSYRTGASQYEDFCLIPRTPQSTPLETTPPPTSFTTFYPSNLFKFVAVPPSPIIEAPVGGNTPPTPEYLLR